MRLRQFLTSLPLILGAALVAQPAEAEGLALSRFDPAPAGDRFFGVQSPFAAGEATPHLMILGDYANNPLVLRSTDDDANLGAVVGGQLLLHLNGSFALFNRLNLNIDVPVAVMQSGDSPREAFASPSGAQFGDLRAGVRYRILGEYHDAFQLAVGGYVWFPTGANDSHVSDGTVRGMPQVIVGGRADRIVWAAAAGPEIRGSKDYAGIHQGTMIKGGAGVAYLLDNARRLQIGPEVNVALTAGDIQKNTTNAEALLGARYRFLDVMEAGLGAGPGLTSGIGTPDFRAVFMVAYSPEPAKEVGDLDGDGIPDELDACPRVAGVAHDDPSKHGCPDTDGDGIIDSEDACPTEAGPASDNPEEHGCPDSDGDGIVDKFDACPTEPGVASDDPSMHGCPLPDRDGDGIPDAVDACPDTPGVASENAEDHGCPPDTDGDGIRDDVDACPREKGKPNEDPEKHGCPEAVRVTETEIHILQQVQFDTGKATIKSVSNALLDEVAGVLNDHPDISKLEIQGHTDNRGGQALNQRLSQQRAESVRKALIDRGISEDRLAAKGFGPDKPIADNKTADGRQKNRRVQFMILEKAPKGEADAK